MINDEQIKNITISMIKDSFYSYFSEPKLDTQHILLDRLFPEERRISSTMSGLQTSLGLFWERLAKKFAEENGFEVLSNYSLTRPSIEPVKLKELIQQVKSNRENHGGDLTQLRAGLDELYSEPLIENDDVAFEPMQKGKGVDLILKKNGIVHIYDIKTVQVNANNGNSLNESVILWIAYYKYAHRIAADNIQARLIFPYNSSNENDDTAWWREFSGRISPLTTSEVSVGNQFWSFITDNGNALQAMIAGFEELKLDQNFRLFYKQVFEIPDADQLKAFSLKVKVRKIEDKCKVKLVEGQLISGGNKKLEWTHLSNNSECKFKATISNLLKEDTTTCSSCSSQFK